MGLAFVAWSASAGTTIVDWTDTHQVIDGFGASCADFYQALPSDMADFFFTTSGIGLSLLRTQVVPSAADCKSFFGREGGLCLDDQKGATVLVGELAIAKQAVARGVTVWSSPWSPPASMKSNHSFIDGGSLLPADYSAWAASLADYVKMMKSNGVPIYAISVQNEPDITQSYGSATYTADQLRDFVPYLFFALQSAGVGSTKIMIAESSQWDFDLTTSAMGNPAAAAKVGILAAHGYGQKPIASPASFGKHIWQTEDSSQSPFYDGSIEDGLLWAVKIHSYLTIANVNAWHWWFLSDGHKYGDGTDNSALTDIKLRYPKRAYVTGQWSKFVRPGWLRIGVEYYVGPLYVSAFKDPANQSFAIVAINSSRKTISQTFSLKGFSTNSVIPWITSAKLSLAAQAPVSVSEARFTYDLPASSVTTFVGSAATAH
ncbi:MAG: glycoside hydrolase [Candidatus Acidiferrales bacterium]